VTVAAWTAIAAILTLVWRSKLPVEEIGWLARIVTPPAETPPRR